MPFFYVHVHVIVMSKRELKRGWHLNEHLFTIEYEGKYYRGPLEGTRDILQSRGLSGMYRGLPTQALRDIPACTAYFLIYEFLIYHGVKTFPSVSSTLQSFVYGGVAGVGSWALILPFDVMKSRIQADTDRKLYSGFWDCVVKSYRSDGIKIFFRGLSMTSLRAFPVNGMTLMTHMELLKLFGEKKHQHWRCSFEYHQQCQPLNKMCFDHDKKIT